MGERMFVQKFKNLQNGYGYLETYLSERQLDLIERYYNLYRLDFLENSGMMSTRERIEIQGQIEPLLLTSEEIAECHAMEFHFGDYVLSTLDFKHLGGLINYCKRYTSEQELERYIDKIPEPFINGSAEVGEYHNQGILSLLYEYRLI